MKKFSYLSLRVLSALMLIGGIFLCFLFHYNEWIARIDHLTADASKWNFLFYVSIGVAVNSLPILGLSYIVEAACRYLDKEETEE